MIPDDLLVLLTAAVDRELTPAEAERVRRVLAESAEARELYNRLEGDRRRLRGLPVACPPVDLVARVMSRLPTAVPATGTPATTLPAPVVNRPRRTPSWAPLAVAASLLLAAGLCSYLILLRPTGNGVVHPANQLAQSDPNRPPHGQNSEPNWTDILPKDRAQLPAVPPHTDPSPSVVATAPSPAERDSRPDVVPAPRPVEPRDVLGFRVLPPIPPLDLVQVRIPFLASLAELDRADVRQKLADELGRDPAFRIDLFATDLHRGIELFQATAGSSGVNVIVDATAQERLRRKQATAYLIYSESLSPTELRDMLVKLAAEDAKAPHRSLDTVHVTPAQSPDLKELKEVLGVDPVLGKNVGIPHNTPGVSDAKPLSAGTADQLAKTLTSPAGKPPEKPALLMTLNPPHLRANAMASKELRLFLERRGERKPTGPPVAIVIRQTSGN